jgi:hypothetical protein
MKVIFNREPFVPEKYEGWHVLSPPRDNQPLTVRMPEWLAADPAYARTPAALDEFRRFLAAFVADNRATFRSRRVVINLYDAPRPLSIEYLKAVQDVFRESAEDRIVDQVVVYLSLLH